MLLRLCSPMLHWQSEQTSRHNEGIIMNGQERATSAVTTYRVRTQWPRPLFFSLFIILI
jgi:hypothetical protein